jgi:tetratricopeptide (TPR) repeat protein
LDWVGRELRNPATNALVLFGQRRIGKTTLLLQLERTLPKDAFLPIYFDLQDQAKRLLGEVLADLADTVSKQAGLEPPDPEVFDHRGRCFHRIFLPQLYQALGKNRRPVFLLDEFDVLDQMAEEGLPDTVASKALFSFLREVMTDDPYPAFVFTVGRRADDLSLDFSATFKASLQREIWVLDPQSAEMLVRQAEANGTLRFTDQAVARILSLTCCHPYLVQLLCQRIWEQAHLGTSTSPPLIDKSEVETIVPDALEAGNQALTWLWNGLGPAEKIYTAALAQTADEGSTIPESRVIQVLADYAPRLHRREVELAPQDLVRRRVLEQVGDRRYQFAVELFRRWVRKNKPIDEVKDELDRIEPFADHLYESGKECFNRQKWEKAIQLFQDALEVNPRHFRARLHLGKVQLERGQIDEAVDELERAYELDRDETRYALIQALVAQAHARGEMRDEDGALSTCERVLQISPNEQVAREMWTAIWRRRGEVALGQNDLQAALGAYRQAGDIEKTAQVEALQRRERLQSLYKQAVGYFIEEDWTQAIRDFKAILAEDPDCSDAADKLEKAKEQEEITTLYIAAIGCQETDKWEKAIEGFSEIIRRVGVYKDVASRLAKVQKQQELARRFRQGENHLHQRNWKEAVQEFEKVYGIDPDYRNVQIRLEEAKRQLRLEELRKLGEASFRDENWQEAVKVFEELRELDPNDGSIVTKLEQANRQLNLAKLYREGIKHLQGKRWRKARKSLEKVVLLAPDYYGGDAAAELKIVQERSARSNPFVEFLRDPIWQGIGVIIAIMIATYPIIQRTFFNPAKPTPTPKPVTLCNGNFEDDFACWHHGGELRQDVQCEGDQCYAVLGSPDYKCEDGVPVGEAWIKQSFQVPLTISPTLSLRYQIFSYDLDIQDFFQVQINGNSVGQLGNSEWNEPSCDREVWDSGWQTIEFDLSTYRGEKVEMLLRNINAAHKWWNTWTYVDDVEVR